MYEYIYLTAYLFFIYQPFKRQPTKWSNTLKQLVGNSSANCLSVFDHFVGLTLKGLNIMAPVK